MSEVKDNPARSRFEMTLGGAMAIVQYRRVADRIVLLHTEVPRGFVREGRRLQAAARAWTTSGRPEIWAALMCRRKPSRCGLVAAYIGRHPEYRDLLADTA